MPLSRDELEYAVQVLGRKLSVEELAVLEAEWSEHCSYKSSRRLLKLLPSNAPYVVVGPGRDAAAIRLFDDVDLVLVFRIESHNHPSAVDPYNGAATGVGGIVRDVLSLGAKPIALVDALFLGDPNDSHARWLAKEIVRGISDYGNRIGVPVVAGHTWHGNAYNRQPLVNVGCIGIAKLNEIVEGFVEPGDPIIVVGNATGRDGLQGSSFASKPLSDGNEELAAIQVGNPFLEKLLIDAIREAVENRLLKHVKDLGGGGLATAVVETAAASGVGATVYLDKLHLREKLEPVEILVSESQERMLVVPKRNCLDKLIAIFDKYGIEYSTIGYFTEDKLFRAYFKGKLVVELPIELVVNPPEPKRASEKPRDWPPPMPDIDIPLEKAGEVILKLISSPRIASKRWIYEQYDWGVGGRTVLPPGYGDAAVIWLRELGLRGVAVKVDGNPRYTKLDPYIGAALALEEAYRNVYVVGAEPLAAVDNVNAGNPEKPEQYWFFHRMVEGLAWIARELEIPVVGGNVSLYNESAHGTMVDPVTTVMVVGRVFDVSKTLGYRLRGKGVLVLLGDTYPELGGSELLALLGFEGGSPPKPRPALEKKLSKLLRVVAEKRLAYAAHDVGVGGLIASIAEMVACSGVGATIDLSSVGCRECRWFEAAFSETQARVVLEVPSEKLDELKLLARKNNVPLYLLGYTGGDIFEVRIGNRIVSKIPVERVYEVYEKTSWEKFMGVD